MILITLPRWSDISKIAKINILLFSLRDYRNPFWNNCNKNYIFKKIEENQKRQNGFFATINIIFRG